MGLFAAKLEHFINTHSAASGPKRSGNRPRQDAQVYGSHNDGDGAAGGAAHSPRSHVQRQAASCFQTLSDLQNALVSASRGISRFTLALQPIHAEA